LPGIYFNWRYYDFTFQNTLSCYASIENITFIKILNKGGGFITQDFKNYDYIIVGILNTNNLQTKISALPDNDDFIDSLKKQNKIILDVFANPYIYIDFGRLIN